MEKRNKPPIGKIYAGINVKGRESLKKQKVPEFKGFPEDFERRLNLGVNFNEGTEKETGIKLYIAIRDFTLHASIMQGKMSEDVNKEIQDRKYESLLNTDYEIQETANLLRNLNIDFKYLLLDDKGTIILVSTEIPDQVPEARKKINESYKQNEIQGLPIDILHITIARVRELPDEKTREESFKKLDYLLRNLRLQISSDPIRATIEDVNLAKGGVAKGGTTSPIKTNE